MFILSKIRIILMIHFRGHRMAKNKIYDKFAKLKTKTVTPKKENKFKMSMLNMSVTVLCIAIATWFSYRGYLETRVNTPYDVNKVCLLYLK